MTIKVHPELSGLRLDKAIASLENIPSRSYAEKLIADGHVLVNGQIQKTSYILRTNDELHIHIPEIAPSELQPMDLKLDIIFEDKDVIVLNKPSGLVVHPAAGHAQDTLVNALLAHTTELSMKNEGRPGIVHRLDKETSGLLVVAKNDFAHISLAEQFKNKITHRIYYAYALKSKKALHTPQKNQGRIESYLARHPTNRKIFASTKDSTIGKLAITHYEKLGDITSVVTHFKLKLETGRTHQIRIHLSEMGYPLLGDTAYGFKTAHEYLKKCPRVALHAAELGFRHPRTNEQMNFQIDWPEDMKVYLEGLIK